MSSYISLHTLALRISLPFWHFDIPLQCISHSSTSRRFSYNYLPQQIPHNVPHSWQSHNHNHLYPNSSQNMSPYMGAEKIQCSTRLPHQGICLDLLHSIQYSQSLVNLRSNYRKFSYNPHSLDDPKYTLLMTHKMTQELYPNSMALLLCIHYKIQPTRNIFKIYFYQTR